MLLPLWDHLNKNLPYAPPSPPPPPRPQPKATTMVQHPLIKKGNSSQGAASLTVSRIWGGAAEPPNHGLSCISYCNCSTLGSKQLGDKAVWGQVGGGVWGKGWRGNLSTSHTVCLLKPNRETLDTNKTHWAAEQTSLSLQKPSSPSFFSFIHWSELSSGLLYFSSRYKSAINPLALTYGEVSIAQGREPSLMVVQEVLGLWHHAVAPQEKVGEDCVDHTKSEDTSKDDDQSFKRTWYCLDTGCVGVHATCLATGVSWLESKK